MPHLFTSQPSSPLRTGHTVGLLCFHWLVNSVVKLLQGQMMEEGHCPNVLVQICNEEPSAQRVGWYRRLNMT